jgi:hypothetical protein
MLFAESLNFGMSDLKIDRDELYVCKALVQRRVRMKTFEFAAETSEKQVLSRRLTAAN